MAEKREERAESMLKKLELLQRKIVKAATSAEEMRRRLATLSAENEDLRRELQEERELNSRLEKDVEFLKLSYRLADNSESLIESRREIMRLIRTLDTCITMLKE